MTLKFSKARSALDAKVPSTALDPHFLWATASGFRAYGGSLPPLFLVAFEIPRPTGGNMQQHCARVMGSVPGLETVWWNANYIYGTIVLDSAGLQVFLKAAAAGLIVRFEVALIPEPDRPTGSLPVMQLNPPGISPAKCQQDVLLGVVDYGCPFASTRLRIATGTRVLNFWDQNGVFNIPGAAAPAGWVFGTSADFAKLDAYRGASAPGDDWALYSNAGLPELCLDGSHGAVVLGCLVGANANASLLWSGVHGHVPVPNPPWTQPTPDLVFVQLPAAYLQGVPRTALSPYRLAGLRYILECAGPNTHRIVVPISSENYEGSHDGQSLFDQASNALVEFALGQGKTLAFHVAAGNSLRTNTNDSVTLAAGGSHTFHVRVPPGNERETYVEVWVPQALDGLSFALQLPGDLAVPGFHSGDGVWLVPNVANSVLAGMVSLKQPSTAGTQRCVTFFIPPSLVATGYGAPVGDWRITVMAPPNVGGVAFAWIARSTPGPGGKLRSHQSIFPRKYSWDWDFINNTPSDAGAVRPYDDYTLSGLATANLSRVVGAYRLRIGDRSLYSAGGPGRPPSRHQGFLIDSAAPGDESRAIPGILGWGNRSAGVVRFAGTSVAAPFAAGVFAKSGSNPVVPPVGRSDPQVPVPNILA